MSGSFIKDIYNTIMRFFYRVIPVRVIQIKDLFPKEPNSSFHIVVAVRNIFIECEKNNDAEQLDLYKRCTRSDLKYYESDVANFKVLMASISENGLNKKFPILVDKEKHVIDGTHRLAVAINLNIKSVYARIVPRSMHPVTAKERLAMLCLSKEDEQKVIDSYHRLYIKLNL